jgi:3-hydroxyacyl-CoA dehydrogenase
MPQAAACAGQRTSRGLLAASGGFISEHDGVVANKLGYILTGGDLSQSAWMDEQYFLDLERESFMSLLGEEKTQARIWHFLQNGKPLRN